MIADAANIDLRQGFFSGSALELNHLTNKMPSDNRAHTLLIHDLRAGNDPFASVVRG